MAKGWKKVLCFGDSNTYGYDPRSYFGSQYKADDRWVDLLGRKLGCRIVNAGENGREIPWKQWELDRFHLMMSNQHVDLLVILLGANDLLQGNSAEDVCHRMEHFLKQIPLKTEQILLIGLPVFQPGVWVEDTAIIDRSIQLADHYKALSERMGVNFVSTADWEIPMAFDGVHFTEEGHRVFAARLFHALQSLVSH